MPVLRFLFLHGGALVDDFLLALEQELFCYCTSFPAVGTVYLGGGTPTVLPDSALAAILAMVRRHVAVAPDAEITLEANPNDLNRKGLTRFRSLGINRLSLGVQSFDDTVLEFLGRRHSAEEARRAIVLARQARFDTISIDLMYGIPGHTQRDWFATLGEALSFAPEHLSCYQLTIKEETPFFGLVQESVFNPAPKKNRRNCLWQLPLSGAHGYSHYEVSNFCRSENLQARHNRIYWEHGPYLGLGPSAHSFDGRRRWWNVKSVEGYIQKLLPGKGALQEIQREAAVQNKQDSCSRRHDETGYGFDMPREGWEELTGEQLRTEALMLGLRTRKGIALDAVLATPLASRSLEKLQADGLITVVDNRIVPTNQGLLLADYVAVELSTK